MAKIFITGSADGLGQLTAKALIQNGHQVVLHARSKERARQALAAAPGAKNVLIADLSSMGETKELAEQANAWGTFDTIVHNAGLYQVAPDAVGRDGFPLLFTVNSLAPYILTCSMYKPARLIYLSSDMHLQGNPENFNFIADSDRVPQKYTYSDTKLHNLILALAVARKWRDVLSNAVDPGWVPTKMGGKGAPDNLQKGFETQVWLAGSEDAEARLSGRYFHHQKQAHSLQAASDYMVQDNLLALCEHFSGVKFP